MDSTTEMRQKLHRYVDGLDDEKMQAMYLLLEEDIEYRQSIFTKEFVAEMNARVERYKADRSTGISPEESKRRIEAVLQKHLSE